MHHALANPDVLTNICAQLAISLPPGALGSDDLPNLVRFGEGAVARRTLARAALACRAFAEPASAALWSVLHNGLLPLFYPLPGFKVVVEGTEVEESPMDELFGGGGVARRVHHEFSGHVSAADWERFAHCARRVRCLLWHGRRPPNVHEPPYLPVLQAAAPLLPGLWGLAFDECAGDPARLAVLRALGTPSLSVVVVRMRHGGVSAFSRYLPRDLEALAETSGRVRRLDLVSSYEPTRHLCSLARFGELRTLNVGLVSHGLYQEVIRDSAGLAYLEELRIATPDSAADDDGGVPVNAFQNSRRPKGRRPARFATLKTLSVAGTHSEVCELLSSIESPSLSHVSISITEEDVELVSSMLGMMCNTTYTASVQQFILTIDTKLILDTVPDGVQPRPVAFSAMFSPLLSLPALEAVELTIFNRVLSLSDADVAHIGDAWHARLRRLVLHSHVRDPDPDSGSFARALRVPAGLACPSLSALASLASRCRALGELRVDGVADVSGEELGALEARADAAAAPGRPETGRARQDSGDVDGGQTRFAHFVLASPGDHCMRLSLPPGEDAVSRVARALRRLFPSLVGPGEGGRGSGRRPNRYQWTEAQRRTDAFRLMEKFNEVL
ncbi:hypothetical protein BD413DRAFT_615244 [Trametes elegans]|nr:hypothetical protein BD413DRAFT_615244 [Trametes elegans]